MAGMTVFPLFLCLLCLSVQAQSESVDCTALEARVQELEALNAKLLERLNSNSDVPYFSMKAVVDSLGAISEASSSALDQATVTYPTDLANSASSAVSASREALLSASVTAVDAATQAWAKAKEAVVTAADMAKDVHEKHVEPHAREYYSKTVDTYTTHVEPHLDTARKVYYESVHPHVGLASEKVFSAYGAAIDGSQSLTPQATKMMQSARQSFSEASELMKSQSLGDLMKPLSFEILGRKFSFPHGWADVALASVQATVAVTIGSWLAFVIMWKLFLKTIFWNLGVKLVGRKIMVKTTALVVKIAYRTLMIPVSIAFFLVSYCLALLFSLTFLAVSGGLGVGMFHGLEKGFTMGLSVGMRLALGFAFGLLFYFFCRCKMCKRSKKAKEATNGKKVNGKKAPEAKKSDPDAKQAPKAAAKKK